MYMPKHQQVSPEKKVHHKNSLKFEPSNLCMGKIQPIKLLLEDQQKELYSYRHEQFSQLKLVYLQLQAANTLL